MSDNFALNVKGLESPADIHRLIVPADGVDLDPKPRSLRVITAGTIAVRDRLGTIIEYPVIAGEIFVFRAQGIEATGTVDAVVAAWE